MLAINNANYRNSTISWKQIEGEYCQCCSTGPWQKNIYFEKKKTFQEKLAPAGTTNRAENR